MCMAVTFDAFPLLPLADPPSDEPKKPHFLASLAISDIVGVPMDLSSGIATTDGFSPGVPHPDVNGFRIGRLKGVGPVVYYHDPGALPCMGGLLPMGVTNLPRNRSKPNRQHQPFGFSRRGRQYHCDVDAKCPDPTRECHRDHPIRVWPHTVVYPNSVFNPSWTVYTPRLVRAAILWIWPFRSVRSS